VILRDVWERNERLRALKRDVTALAVVALLGACLATWIGMLL
jgi:hypothetical protein